MTAGLNVHIVSADEAQVFSSVENRLPECEDPLAAELRRLRENIAAAVEQARDAIQAAAGPLNDAVSRIEDILNDTNTLLVQNPNRDVVSVNDLADANECLRFGSDTSDIALRLGRRFGTPVSEGVLFPPGNVDLWPYSRLASALGCDIADMRRRLDAAPESFVFVTVHERTVTETIENACGEPITRFRIIESVIAIDRSIQESARIAGIAESAVSIRIFWVDAVRATSANLARLTLLGVRDADFEAAITNTTEGRVESYVLLRSVVTALRSAGLSDQGVCDLMLTATSDGLRINPTPTLEDIRVTVENLLRSRSECGAPPLALMLPTVDFGKSLGLPGAPVDRDALDGGCGALYDALDAAVNAVQFVMNLIRSFLSRQILNVGVGGSLSTDGLGLTNCLIRFNLGISLSFNIVLGFPAKFRLLNLAISAAIAVILKVINAVSLVICIAEAIVQAIYGGICGLSALNTGLCPAPLELLVEKARLLCGLARSVTFDLGVLLGDHQLSFGTTGQLAASLNIQATCQSKIVTFAALTFAAIEAAANERRRAEIAQNVSAGVESTVNTAQTGLVGTADQIKRNFTP